MTNSPAQIPSASKPKPGKLSGDQLSFFQANGYLNVDDVFLRSELDELNAELEERYQERLQDSEIAQTEEA